MTFSWLVSLSPAQEQCNLSEHKVSHEGRFYHRDRAEKEDSLSENHVIAVFFLMYTHTNEPESCRVCGLMPLFEFPGVCLPVMTLSLAL